MNKEEHIPVITDREELYNKCENMEQLFDKYYLPLLDKHYSKTYKLQQENQQQNQLLKDKGFIIDKLMEENRQLKEELEKIKQPTIFIDTQDMEERYGEQLYQDYLVEQNKDLKKENARLKEEREQLKEKFLKQTTETYLRQTRIDNSIGFIEENKNKTYAPYGDNEDTDYEVCLDEDEIKYLLKLLRGENK